jgi:pantoate--beta-alanine ligase
VKLVRGVAEARVTAARLRSSGSLAFVPTMGALHAGHASLVARARELAPRVALSVFVNPLQFGPHEDLGAYPRDLERDAAQAERWGVDLLFAPAAAEFTPPGATVSVDPVPLGSRLEGRARPGHFRGVLTIVAKLFHVLAPDVALFGRKDLQQVVLVRQMVRDLDLDVRIEEAPTVREADGLALSSRNAYLSPVERRQATALYRALRAGERALGGGTRDAGELARAMRGVLEQAPALSPDYVAVLRTEDLAEVEEVHGTVALVAAARVGRTRLIDNLIVTAGAPS